MNSPQPPVGGRRLVSSAAFKDRLGGVSETTRWRMERNGIGPKPVKFAGRNYYLAHELDTYLDQLAASRHNIDEAVADDQAERTTATCTNEGATGD